MDRRRFLRTGALGVAGVALGGAATGGVGTTAAAATATEQESSAYAPIGRLDLDAAYEAVVAEDGATAFVATGDGFVVIDLSDPADPRQVAERSDLLTDRENGPLTRVWDLAVDGTDLLVAGPANPNRSVNAAVRFDVSDPADPEQVAVAEVGFPIHNCALADGVGYLTDNDRDRNPLVVVDLGADAARNGDGGAGEELARWSVIDADPAWDDVRQTLRVVHDVSVTDGVAALAYWDAGTHLLDVSDPATPEYLGGVTPREPDDLAALSAHEVTVENSALPGNHHYAETDDTGDLLAVNAEAWAVETGDGLRGGPGGVHLYDASDPTDIVSLSTIAPLESPDPTGSGVWTTAHNFELRGDRLYTAWYEGGVTLHDVSDPTAPAELARWRDPAHASFWTARVGVPGEFFVAPSTSHRPAQAALYTFPDRAGEQADPPALRDALPDASTETPAAARTPADATDTRAPANATDGAADDAETDGEAAGFGLGTATGALAAGAGLLRAARRVRDGGDDDGRAE
ncbi:LVIVD repeat-containing protein [Haloparvum sedimenti]|uniref:LVIVD repeat-containing protein n=1 Tax=Haloparvum sedimenti TaxID=1678448 RepID=UPI0009B5B02A|nr:hypothetical protein [Haloparvum sedimenti]